MKFSVIVDVCVLAVACLANFAGLITDTVSDG